MSNQYRLFVGTFAVDFNFDGWSQTNALNHIRDILTNAAKAVNSTSFQPEKLVNAIIRTAQQATIADLYKPGDYVNRIRLTMDSWTYKLQIFENNGYTSVWSGSLTYFNANQHIKSTPSFSTLKDKVVRFSYSGGTTPGGTRLIKVTSYANGNLHGTDLVKNDHRQFKTAQISNLEVVPV